MKLLEDLRLKHIAAFIGNDIGKSVYLISISVDPEIYFSEDADGKMIPDTDFQYFTAIVQECGENKPKHHIEGKWLCEDEEIIVEDHYEL